MRPNVVLKMDMEHTDQRDVNRRPDKLSHTAYLSYATLWRSWPKFSRFETSNYCSNVEMEARGYV